MKMSPTNPFRTDVGLEWCESREQHESRKFESRRSQNFTEGETRRGDSEMNVANEELMRIASEEMEQFKLAIAELLQEVKDMQSELQKLQNERTEYGSLGIQGKASPRRKFRRNRAYKKNRTLKCFKCRKPGHMKRDCPDRVRTTAGHNELS